MGGEDGHHGHRHRPGAARPARRRGARRRALRRGRGAAGPGKVRARDPPAAVPPSGDRHEPHIRDLLRGQPARPAAAARFRGGDLRRGCTHACARRGHRRPPRRCLEPARNVLGGGAADPVASGAPPFLRPPVSGTCSVHRGHARVREARGERPGRDEASRRRRQHACGCQLHAAGPQARPLRRDLRHTDLVRAGAAVLHGYRQLRPRHVRLRVRALPHPKDERGDHPRQISAGPPADHGHRRHVQSRSHDRRLRLQS